MITRMARAMAGLAQAAIRCKASVLWHAVCAQIEGRHAVSFEKERRMASWPRILMWPRDSG